MCMTQGQHYIVRLFVCLFSLELVLCFCLFVCFCLYLFCFCFVLFFLLSIILYVDNSETSRHKSLNFHTSIVNRVHAKQLTYFGHVKRMRSYRYPKVTLEGIIPGKWGRGRPSISRPTATSLDWIQSSRQDELRETVLHGNFWWLGSYLQNLLATFCEDSFKSSK